MVEAAIDALVGKGYIASFEYDDNGLTEKVFCLSSYCHRCLKKDSISVQMRGFWDLSFGDFMVDSSGKLEKNIVEKFIRNNKRLTEYLYGVKGIVEPEEYQTIKHTIKWKKNHYQIAVVKNGETTFCSLYDSKDVFDKTEESGILIVGEEVDNSIKNSNKKIFVYHNQEINLLDEFSGKLMDEEIPMEESDGVKVRFREEDKVELDNNEESMKEDSTSDKINIAVSNSEVEEDITKKFL